MKPELSRQLSSSLGALLLAACHMTPAPMGDGSPPEAKSLDDSYWWVEDIDGVGVLDNSHTTIGFSGAGQVTGDSGCNRYRGSAAIDGNTLRFGPLAGTRRACPPAVMNQELRFYQAMEQVAAWRIAGTGLLHLVNAQGQVLLRAAPIEPAQL
jgi:putative lipoprotein